MQPDEKDNRNGITNQENAGPASKNEAVFLNEQKQRDQAPLWNCKLIVSYPYLCFTLGVALQVAGVVVMVTLALLGYELLPDDVGEVFLDVRHNRDFLRGLAWLNKYDGDDVVKRITKQMERTEVGEGMEFLFECKGCNVFTKSNFESMQQAELDLMDDREFQDKYCHLSFNHILMDGSYICTPPYSVLRLFDGSLVQLLGPDFNDSQYDRIEEIVYKAYTLGADYTDDLFAYILPKKYTIELRNNNGTPQYVADSELIRGTLLFGLPLAGYNTTMDRLKKQEEKVIKYLEDDYGKIPEKIYDDKAGKLHFYYNSENLFFEFFDQSVFRDSYFLIGSFSFIFLFVWLQTCSLFITTFCTGSLATSFCITNLLYRFIFDFRYFSSVHFIAVFIVLGIGVDDIFIFTNTWKHSGENTYLSLAHRLSDVYRQTAIPMFFTTLTTMIAFAVNIANPLRTISTLSVFAGLFVVVIYFSVIVYVPTVITVYHLLFEKYGCCFKRKQTWNDETKEHTEKPVPNPVRRFFSGPYHKFITNDIVSGFIVVAVVGIAACFVYYASTIETEVDLVYQNPFEKNNNFGKFIDRRNNKFRWILPVNVYLIWGLKEQDLSDCHYTDMDCTGDTRYDNSFHLNTDENQQALKALCDKLKNLTDSKIKDLHIKTTNGIPDVDCFLTDMETFYKEEEPNRFVCNPLEPTSLAFGPRYSTDPMLRLAFNETDARTVMAQAPYVYRQPISGEDGFKNWFEIAMSFWLYGGWPTGNVPNPFAPGTEVCAPVSSILAPFGFGMPRQFWDYNDMVGEEITDSSHTIPMNDFEYSYGTRLKWAAIRVATKLDGNAIQFDKGLKIRDEWEDFMKDELKKMPEGLKKGFQTTAPDDNYDFNVWHNLEAQKALVISVWYGISFGLLAVFVFVSLGSMNLLTGFIAMLIQGCSTAVVIGFLPMDGVKLNINECIVITIAAGVSADYCIHVALAYGRSHHVDRKTKSRDALDDIGLSISSGVLTTLGSCFFMFFCIMRFFGEFARIVFVAMGSAYVLSIVALPSILGLIGPQGSFASLKAICCFCCRRKSN